MVIKKSAQAIHRLFWVLMVFVLFLAAAYVSLGRYYIDYIDEYQDSLVGEFVTLTGLKVEVDSLYGTWSQLYPSLTLEQVSLFDPNDASQQVLAIGKIDLTIDIISTLMTGSLQANGLHISGLEGKVEEFAVGQWRLRGYPYQSGDSNYQNIIDRILLFKSVILDDVRLDLFYLDNSESLVVVDEFKLDRRDQFRRAKLQLVLDQSLNPLNIIIEANGDPRDINAFSASAYASFDNLDFSGQLSFLRGFGVDLNDARINSELWAQCMPGGQCSVEGRIATPMLALAALSKGKYPDIENFSSHFKLQANLDNEWHGWIAELSGEVNAQAFDVKGLQFSYQDKLLKVAARQLALAPIVSNLLQLQLLQGKGLDALSTLSPVGELTNMHLQVDTSAEPEQLFSLRANLDNVSVNPWAGSPGVSGLYGYLEVEADSGSLLIDSKHFVMEFPGIYHQLLDLGKARGQVDWRIADGHIYVDSGPISIQADHGPAVALLRLDLPLEPGAADPLMTLEVGMQDIDAGLRNRYIPYILSPDLLRWLSASIQSGRILNGGFIYRGSLSPDDDLDRTVQLFINVEDLALDYHPDWPLIEHFNGLAVINDLLVDVETEHATVSGLAVSNTRVELKPLDQGTWVTVTAAAQGELADAMRIVTGSAGLRRIVGTTFDHWQLDGDINAQIELGVPLANDALAAQIKFDAELANGNLDITDLNLQLRDFSGPLRYSSASGFNSSGIVGSFFKRPAEILVKQGAGQPLHVAINGRAGMRDVANWTKQPALMFFSGASPFTANISIGPDSSELQLDSTMQGVSIDLPAPFNKPAAASWPFHFHMPLGENPALLSMNLADKASLQLQLADGDFNSGLLILDNTMDASLEPGFLTVTGQVETASWDQWYPRYERYLAALEAAAKAAAADTGQQQGMELKVRQLYLDHVDTFAGDYKDVVLDLSQQARYWQLDADTEKFQGRVLMPMDSADPWVYQLEKFVIDIGDDSATQTAAGDSEAVAGNTGVAATTGEPGSVFASLDPATLQDADVAINHLFMGEEAIGTISFSMRSDGRGVVLDKLVGDIRAVTIGTEQHPGKLAWYQDELGDHSEFQAVLRFRNLAEVFDRWGFDRAIVSKKGDISVDINWPAKPDEWTLAQSNGQYQLTIKDGRFLKTSDTASGALKVVSILNLNNILRRLKLDFSDISKGGVSFDDLEGGFEISDSYLEITDPLLINSPSSQFLFYGGTDIQAEKLNMELIATLPVAGNLPWVAAAFLGGLPVAAGVYVATKVFQNQVDQVSSAVYSLEGSWDDPQLNFKKFYAGQLSDKKAIKAAQDAAQAAEQEQGQEQGQEQEQEQGQEQDLDPDTAADPDTLKEPG